MEYALNYISSFAFGLSLSFILLLCFCWNKKQSLTQKRHNPSTDNSVTSCQKITYNHHKYFTVRLIRPHKCALNTVANTTTSTVETKTITTTKVDINHDTTNHVLIKNSNLFVNEDDLAYATTIGLNTNMNSTDIISPSSYPLLHQDSNTHRNCELPPVPTYYDAAFTENKQIKIDHHQTHVDHAPLPEDNMDQLTCYYYSIPTVKQLISNKHHLYDVTIPKLLQSIKKHSLTGVSDTNNRCYSLCDDDVDDPTSDSDGLYASVSHPPPPFPSSTIGNNFVTQETLQDTETIVNVNITSTTTTNSNSMYTNENMTGNRRDPCQSHYSQLKDECNMGNNNNSNNEKKRDGNIKNQYHGVTTVTTTATNAGVTLQFPKFSSKISNDNNNDNYNNNKIIDNCQLSNQPTRHNHTKIGNCYQCSTTPCVHLYAQVTPCTRTQQSTLANSEMKSNNSVYSSNYIRPPIPVRGYDQTDIDLVNQIRISSRQLDVTTPDQSIDHHDVESRRVLTETNYRRINVCESLANLRSPVLCNSTKHNYHQCFDDSDTNQESSEYERIYSITSTESTDRNIVQLVSTEKQNNETTISHDNNKLEHSYTEISSSIDDLATYSQVYYSTACGSIDYPIVKTTESFNMHNSSCSPTVFHSNSLDQNTDNKSYPNGDDVIIKESCQHNDYTTSNHASLNDKNQPILISNQSLTPSLLSETVVYSVTELHPSISSNLNDKMLAEIQAFRHMDSELDLTQSTKYFMVNNSQTETRRLSDSFMNESEEEQKTTVGTLQVVTQSLYNQNQREDTGLMTPLMERSTEDCSRLSTIHRTYSKAIKCDGQSSSSLSHSTILSPSSLSLSIKTPANYSISDFPSPAPPIVVTVSNNCSVAPFACAEFSFISDPSAYDDIDNL
ncbi:unnamed protein product [Schistosoma margrebowiei]|uniref:Uncharacterized protein n=1 Tax=Schistosoma margrebowiei TaxID=48269 RepID=A0AA85ANH1_9TREM|nr:unnamed protein product [Schistosoma margrebowiei]